MAGVTVFALDQRREAREQAQEAKAHELRSASTAELDRDPELSPAPRASRRRVVAAPSAAGRRFGGRCSHSRVRAVVELGEPLLDAHVRGARSRSHGEGEVIVVTAASDRGDPRRRPRAASRQWCIVRRRRDRAAHWHGRSSSRRSGGRRRPDLAGVRGAAAAATLARRDAWRPSSRTVACASSRSRPGAPSRRSRIPARSPPRSRPTTDAS